MNSMNFFKAAISIALSFVLVACQYEVSPWSTDVDCPSSVSIDYNIKRLQALEAEEGPRSDYKVALLSDPQMYPGAFENVVKRINARDDISFILLTGDLAETGIKAEFEWTCKVMAKSNKPIFAVIGNHDALSFGTDIWLDVIGPENYSFTYQNSKFIAYNDNKYEFANVPDRVWLADEAGVAAGEVRAHTFAFSHIPPWPEDLALSHELKDLGFDLTLHGHEHDFDFWQLFDVQLPHYVSSFTKFEEYGILTVEGSNPYVLENCRGATCTVATPRTVND